MNDNPAKFTKPELDQLVRDLKLSKEKCCILLSALKIKNLLADAIDVHVYDDREKEIEHFFDELDGTPFIKDIYGLLEWLNFDYEPAEWQLLIKFKNSRLKCFLIHRLKKYDSLPFIMSNEIEDAYATITSILEIVNYREHNWPVYGDFKKVSLFICV